MSREDDMLVAFLGASPQSVDPRTANNKSIDLYHHTQCGNRLTGDAGYSSQTASTAKYRTEQTYLHACAVVMVRWLECKWVVVSHKQLQVRRKLTLAITENGGPCVFKTKMYATAEREGKFLCEAS